MKKTILILALFLTVIGGCKKEEQWYEPLLNGAIWKETAIKEVADGQVYEINLEKENILITFTETEMTCRRDFANPEVFKIQFKDNNIMTYTIDWVVTINGGEMTWNATADNCSLTYYFKRQ